MSEQQPPNYPPQPQEPYQGQPQYQQPQQGFQGQPQQPYYSQQPMMPPTKKKHTGRNVLIAVIVVVVVLAACGGIAAAVSNLGKSANTGTVVNNGSTSTIGNTQATSAPTSGSSTFKLGQLVSVGNTWQITVLSAKTSAGSQFNTPQKPGDLFLIVTVSVKNISSQSQTMSGDFQWTLQDTTGQKYTIGFDSDAGATLDGAVAAGRPLKGVLVYEVPKTVKAFTLSYQNDITSSDQSIWDITV